MKSFGILQVIFFALVGSISAQPAQGEPFPQLVLDRENGGKLGGGGWQCSDVKGKPCLLVLIHPDHQELLDPVEQALANTRLSARECSLVKVMDTQSSWKPDGMIQAGAWLSQIAGKVSEARESGLIQALFTDRKNKPAHWSVVYDQNLVFRSALRLNDRPVHVFLLDKRGVIVSYHAGNPSDTNARVWIQMMKQLGASS
ncbi:MAG: hypothetical protein K9I85_15950 [Saprospiraceae bacterium]|nr:hypothetical protein [Saprospiraceae bacterium]